MSFKILLLLALTATSIFTFVKAEEASVLANKLFDEQYEVMSKGMTPEMKIKLKKALEDSKKMIRDYEALTPEQRKKKDEEAKKNLNSPDAQSKIKKSFESMPAEDKKMFKIMMENASKRVKELADPNSPAHKKMIQNIPQRSNKTPEEVVNSKISTAYELDRAAMEIGNSPADIEGAEKILWKIVKHPNSEADALISVASALSKAAKPYPHDDEIFKELIHSSKLDMRNFGYVVNNYYSPRNIETASVSGVQNILATKKSNEETLALLSYVIVRTKTPAIEKDVLLLQVVDSPQANVAAFTKIARSLEYAEGPIFGVEKVFEKIIDSPLMNLNSLREISESIDRTKALASGKKELYEKISSKDPLTNLTVAMKKSTTLVEGAEQILEKELNSESISSRRLGRIGLMLGNAKVPLPGTEKLLRKILNSPNTDADSLSAVAYVINRPNIEIKESEKMLQEIIDSSKSNDWTLLEVVDGLKKIEAKNANKMLKQIFQSSVIGEGTFKAILGYIAWSKAPVPDAGKMIQEIMDSPKKGNYIFKNISEALRRSQTPIDGAGKIFQQIINSSTLDRYGLGAVALAMSKVQYPIEGINKMLIQMANMKLADEDTMYQIRLAATSSKNGVKDSENLLLQLDAIKSKK